MSTRHGFAVVVYRKWKKSSCSLIITGDKEKQVSGGRLKVPFNRASLKTNQCIVKPLLETHSTEELALATEMSYRASASTSGSKDAALIFHTIS